MEITQGVRFDSLKLSPEILRALLERNIVQSTPVQAGCIHHAGMAGCGGQGSYRHR